MAYDNMHVPLKKLLVLYYPFLSPIANNMWISSYLLVAIISYHR